MFIKKLGSSRNVKSYERMLVSQRGSQADSFKN